MVKIVVVRNPNTFSMNFFYQKPGRFSRVTILAEYYQTENKLEFLEYYIFLPFMTPIDLQPFFRSFVLRVDWLDRTSVMSVLKFTFSPHSNSFAIYEKEISRSTKTTVTEL